MGITFRELVTLLSFSANTGPIDQTEKRLQQYKASADKLADGAVKAFQRPRDEIGRFLTYKDRMAKGIFSEENGGLLGGLAGKAGRDGDKFEAAGAAFGKMQWMAAKLALELTAMSYPLISFFKEIGKFEQYDISFEAMIGDADLAKKTMNDLKNFAKSTPFNFGEVAELSQRLLAADFAANELVPTMGILGDIAAGVGKDKLPQLVHALDQVKSGGRLTGRELNEFTMASVPLIGALAKIKGVGQEQVRDLVSAGGVSFQDTYDALRSLTTEGGKFNGLMEKLSHSLLGMFSNVVDSVELLMVRLGERGLRGQAKAAVQAVSDYITNNADQIIDTLHSTAEILVSAIGKIIGLVRNAYYVVSAFTSVLGGNEKAMRLLVATFGILIGARSIFLLGQFAQALLFVGNTALWTQIKLAAIPLAIGASLIALGLIIEDIVGYFQGRKSITGLILGQAEGISDAFDKFMEPILKKVMKFGQNVGKLIANAFSGLGDADYMPIVNFISKAMEIFLNVSRIPVQIGLAIAEGIMQGLVEGLSKRFPAFKSLIGDFGLDKDFRGPPAPLATFPGGKPTGWIPDMIEGFTNWKDNFNRSSDATIQKNNSLQKSGDDSAQVINMNATTTVNVPTGTSQEQAVAMVQDGIKEGFSTMLRELSRATAPSYA